MIDGAEMRTARERANLTQGELAKRVGVSLRTVGNWERGESVPRSKEQAIRAALGDHIQGSHPGDGTTLRAASDAELLAEIARRFARRAEPQPVTLDSPARDEFNLAARRADPNIGHDQIEEQP